MFIEIADQLNETLVRQILSACLFDKTPEGIDNAIRKYPGELFYGWIVNGEAMGICGFRVLNNKVEICHIAVSENSRRKGIGKAMIIALWDKYNMPIEAETDDDAVGFYKKCGFETTAIYKEEGSTKRRRWMCILHNGLLSQIVSLEREKWQGYVLPFHYVSNNYFDVEIKRSNDDFYVSFIKKHFDSPFVHEPSETDRLFQPWWDDVKAWGIIKNGRLVAAVETSVEDWNNRLRVTELWVDEAYRRRGVGTALMDIAVYRAREEKRRVVILETQSCNENAIAFYLAYGFTLIGFNACEYQNNDLQRKEVRMEMGILIQSNA